MEVGRKRSGQTKERENEWSKRIFVFFFLSEFHICAVLCTVDMKIGSGRDSATLELWYGIGNAKRDEPDFEADGWKIGEIPILSYEVD